MADLEGIGHVEAPPRVESTTRTVPTIEAKRRKFTAAAAGKLFVRLLDYFLLALCLLGLIPGILVIAYNVRSFDEDSLTAGGVGALLVMPFLALVLAWMVSHRLFAMSQVQKEMREDLDELIRRTEQSPNRH